ncbi:MAG: alpha/beta hydrolase [Acidimicrobiales bacterium]
MSEYVDWPIETLDPLGLAVLLPGQNYPATMPLLTFAGHAARQHGWRVRAVSWRVPDLDLRTRVAWVGTQLQQAVGEFEGRVLVVGKSLGTCSADYASRHGYDAVWLTPLLRLPDVVEAMVRTTGRQLLIGGTQDPAWDSETAGRIGGDVVEIDGADHGMFVPDAVRTAEVHVDVTRAIVQWLRVIS